MHSNDSALILEIKGNSLDDGPGIRSVVFFKGCPLSCVWCHNPESRKAVAEMSFDGTLCVDCGTCRAICPENALSANHPHYIDRGSCTLCFDCVAACPSGALERVGKALAVDDVLGKILPDKPFFMTSGGGVTVSGGEATLHMDFVSRLLMELKREGIHTLLETCGQFDLSRFMDRVYPYLDTIYFDIKLMDSQEHKRFCGVPNQTITDNFKHILKATRADGKSLVPRTPLVPGITDTEDNIRAIAVFLRDLDVRQADLLDYNPLWHEKHDKIGSDDPYKTNRAMTSFPERSVRDRCTALFAEAGIHVFRRQ